MKAWCEVLFKTLYNKIVEATFYFVERDRAGDKKISTRLINKDVIQSFSKSCS